MLVPARAARCASLICTLALTAGMARADTLWVDAAVPGPGTGTQADPYPDIQTAIDALPTPGGAHWINVAAGTYAGFEMPTGMFSLSITGAGAEETVIGPSSMLGGIVRYATFDGQGATAVEGSGTIEFCVVRNAAVGVSGVGSVWTSTIVSNGIGIAGPTDVTDVILYGNGVDLTSTGIGCSNKWQTWQHPTQGFLSQSFDPLFWDFAEGDYHLRAGSPCIGIGCWVPDCGAFYFDAAYAPAPTTYCTSKTTSDGCTAMIGWSGANAASLTSTTPFLVTAAGVSEHKNGTFFYGLAEMQLPYQGGWLCVQPPTSRTGLQPSGSAGGSCTGTYSLDFSAFAQSGVAPFLAPGMSIYGQYWYRDPADPFQSARTDAIEFGLID